MPGQRRHCREQWQEFRCCDKLRSTSFFFYAYAIKKHEAFGYGIKAFFYDTSGLSGNDLEYLQQTYPGEVRRCQRRIAEILDKYDYEGSMIYDEYPDRLSLFRIADTISTILEQEAEKVSKDLIHVLVCNEIYKRRHGGRRGMIAFL